MWNADDISYIETLFGHQDLITSIDTLAKERCLTSGSRDRTARLWKILEESQLVFRAGGGISISEDLVVMDELKKEKKIDAGAAGGSIDVVAMLDEDHFITGSDSGYLQINSRAISLWNTQRKKPIFTRLNAHGAGSKFRINGEVSQSEQTEEGCSWITALAAVPYTDLFASGSADGFIKLWKLSDSKKSFVLLNSVSIV